MARDCLLSEPHHDELEPRGPSSRKQATISYEPLSTCRDKTPKATAISGRWLCDSYTTDASGLAATRATFENPRRGHIILPEISPKEPLGPWGAVTVTTIGADVPWVLLYL